MIRFITVEVTNLKKHLRLTWSAYRGGTMLEIFHVFLLVAVLF